MTPKLLCISSCLLGVLVSSCTPESSGNKVEANTSENSSALSSGKARRIADVPLEIAISQFPSGYQGGWALTVEGCTDDAEGNEQMIALQGRLLKFPKSIDTMIAGKRMTSKTMAGEFAFEGEGDKWNRTISFELSEDRMQLTRRDAGVETSYRYVQCPKLMAG